MARAVVLFVTAAAATVRVAMPAGAVPQFCPSDLHSGDDMVRATCTSWRSGYVFDAGAGQLTTRGDIARYQHVYTHFGFGPNFTWYAVETTRTFVDGRDSGVKWAGCFNDNSGETYATHEHASDNTGNRTGMCTDLIVRAQDRTKTLLDAFASSSVTLRVLTHGDAFIALECGNFSVPGPPPVPTISGVKFHDTNRNGAFDGSEPGLGGWQMTLVRVSSLVGQGTGPVSTVVTGADGRYSFTLDGHGPGTYRVVETQREGFVQTRAPGTVTVGFGVGSHDFKGNDFGNVEDRADVVKAAWNVISAPERMEAGVPAELTVRATITNNGPAPSVEVTDQMSVVHAPADCVATPLQPAVKRRLAKDETAIIDFTVVVTCEDPSFHRFEFANTVVVEGGVEDPDPGNNTRLTDVTLPVFDDADVTIGDAVLTCPDRADADLPFTCTATALLRNLGPYGPANADVTFAILPPADCVTDDGPSRLVEDTLVPLGDAVAVTATWTLTCTEPSDHPISLTATAELDHLHVEDHWPGNDATTAHAAPEVFDDADLSITDAVLDCPPRQDVDLSFTCVGTTTLRNAGPYGAVEGDVTLTVAPPADCTVTDGVTREFPDVEVGAGEEVLFTVPWQLECTDRSYHPITMRARVALDHLHVEDHWPANDATTATDTVEIFEAADLRVEQPMRIACGGRLPSITTFGCDVLVTVTNAGPATDVMSETTTTLTAPADCAVTPATTSLPATLAAGETRTFAYHFDVSCSDAVLHTLLAGARIAATEPHAEDRDLANNTGRVRWLPTDAKPGSDPSSVNAGKEGVVPVAILSTREFDASVEVDQPTIRWGVTGFEQSLVGCGGEFADTNGDGFADLVCRFDTTLAGLTTCGTKVAIMTGYLKDGTPFESQDPINVVGCKK